MPRLHRHRQAPAVGRNSPGTFPRDFPGRSGTEQDAGWLCSPETVRRLRPHRHDHRPPRRAAMAGMPYPRLLPPERASVNRAMLEPPPPPEEAARIELERGPDISGLPDFDPLPDVLEGPVLLTCGDNVSTDEISPAGAQALPYRSDIPKLAEFTFTRIDPDYPRPAAGLATDGMPGRHFVVGGENYGQGSLP